MKKHSSQLCIWTSKNIYLRKNWCNISWSSFEVFSLKRLCHSSLRKPCIGPLDVFLTSCMLCFIGCIGPVNVLLTSTGCLKNSLMVLEYSSLIQCLQQVYIHALIVRYYLIFNCLTACSMCHTDCYQMCFILWIEFMNFRGCADSVLCLTMTFEFSIS